MDKKDFENLSESELKKLKETIDDTLEEKKLNSILEKLEKEGMITIKNKKLIEISS